MLVSRAVRWLLSHRAGLCAISAPLPAGSLYDWDRMCEALAAQAPWWTPGAEHGYHALTFGFLVGEVVRRITGESIGAYFRRHVAEPLGVDFHIGVPAEHEARVSDIYGVHIGNLTAPPDAPSEAVRADAGPLSKFVRALQDSATMQHAALYNPPQERAAVNTREWRAAEIPAVNGHGTAHALARSDTRALVARSAWPIRMHESDSVSR